MTDPFEQALKDLEDLIRASIIEGNRAVAEGRLLDVAREYARKIVEAEDYILNHARWIGDDDDCTCTPDGDACGYCQRRYQLERERTKE